MADLRVRFWVAALPCSATVSIRLAAGLKDSAAAKRVAVITEGIQQWVSCARGTQNLYYYFYNFDDFSYLQLYLLL